MSAFGLEGENQNENEPTLNKRMKTKVRRKTGPARKDDLRKILTALRGNSAKTLAITNVISSFGFRWLRCQ